MKTYLHLYEMNSKKKEIFWAVQGINDFDSGIFQSFDFMRLRYGKRRPDDLKITMHDTEAEARNYLESKNIILN